MQRHKTLGVPRAVGCRGLALVLAAAGLCGCSSISEKMTGPISQLPGIGLPAGAPDRSADPPAYPAVHDMPPARTSPTLTGLEQKEMEDDLVAAHDEQMKLVGRKPEAKDVKKTGSLKPQNNAKNEASIDPKNHRTEPMYLPPQPAPAAKPAATGIY